MRRMVVPAALALALAGCGWTGKRWQEAPIPAPALTKAEAARVLLVPENVGPEFVASEDGNPFEPGCLHNPTDVLDYLGPVEAKAGIRHESAWPTVETAAWAVVTEAQMSAAFDDIDQAIGACTEVAVRLDDVRYEARVRAERRAPVDGADQRTGYVAAGWGRNAEGERWQFTIRTTFLRYGSVATAVSTDADAADAAEHESLVEIAGHRLEAVLDGRVPELEHLQFGEDA